LVDPQRMLQDASIRCDELLQRLEMAVRRGLDTRESDVRLLRTRLGTPLPRIQRARDSRSTYELRLKSAAQTLLTARRQALTKNMAVLDSLSPLKVLDRGFSMVLIDGKIITHAKDLAPGDPIAIRMCRGSVEAEVKKVNKDER
jgi:exodeoxyribonuclease VII large subunit